MIQAIGLMVAAYIFTRMLQLLGMPDEYASGPAKFAAIITLLVTVVMAFVLLGSGIDLDQVR